MLSIVYPLYPMPCYNQNMITALSTTFWGRCLATVLMSMIPVGELRSGIPFGVGIGLPVWAALIASIIGNMIPIPFILIFLRRIFSWLKTFKKPGEWAAKLEKKGHLKGQKMTKYGSLGLMILVAIPLPGTGAWTGALVASVLEMDFKKAIWPITLGVCIAGFIVAGITYGVVSIF